MPRPTRYSAIQAVIYSLVLLPVGVLPYYAGMSGRISLVIVAVANVGMIWQCVDDAELESTVQ